MNHLLPCTHLYSFNKLIDPELRAEVEGLAAAHHLAELLPELAQLRLGQLLPGLLRGLLGGLGAFPLELLRLRETGAGATL